MARLIDADALVALIQQEPTDGMYTEEILEAIGEQPTIEATLVVHGEWVKYTHSALIAFKNGEPVWADRAVYRCDHCYFGTIAKHNYCPRCGAKMDGGVSDG